MNHPGYYLHWGVIQISAANLIVIAEMEIRGLYQEVVPQERLVCTESWGGEWPETRNTVTFAEHDGMTTVVNAVRYPSLEARDAALRTGMNEGISKGYDALDALLSTME